MSKLLSQHLVSTGRSNTEKRAGFEICPLARVALAVLYQKIVLLDIDQIAQEGNGMKPYYASWKISSLFDFGPLF